MWLDLVLVLLPLLMIAGMGFFVLYLTDKQ